MEGIKKSGGSRKAGKRQYPGMLVWFGFMAYQLLKVI